MGNYRAHFAFFLKLIKGLCMLAVFSFAIHAHSASSPECTTLVQKLAELSRGYYERLANWGARWKTFEGAKENALHLALKDANPESDKIFLGFITKVENPQNLSWFQTPVKKFMHTAHLGIGKKLAEATGTTYSPNSTYYLSVFSGLENTLSELPNFLIRPLTQFTMKQKMELRLPALMATYYFTYDYLSKKYDERLVNKVLKEADARSAELDEMIAYDYRFAELKNLLETLKTTDRSQISSPELLRMKDLYDQGKLDQRQVRLMALLYSKLLQKYYAHMETHYQDEDPEESFSEIMGNPLFQHVRTLVESGVQLQSGFRRMPGSNKKTGSNSTLTQAEISELIDLQHLTLEKQNLIPLLAKSIEARNKQKRNVELSPEEQKAIVSIEEMRKTPERSAIIDDILNDEYTKFLLILHERGSINSGELQYRLGEDAYYQRRFAEYNILKVQRLVMNEDGTFTDEPLTLDLIRKINARELAKKVSNEEKKPSRGPASIPEIKRPPPKSTDFNAPIFVF